MKKPLDYKLKRVFAFSVEPQRTSEGSSIHSGGPCNVSAEISQLVHQNISDADFSKKPQVVFNCDATTRTCETREALMTAAFAPLIQADLAAKSLAHRLSKSMDNRSSPCLLVVAAEVKGTEARVTLWIFPKDSAFRFSVSKTTSVIDILNDVFSQSSHLRKAAMFEGENFKTSFLDGRIVDHQIGTRGINFANFWVERFLDAKFSVTPTLGTKMLAATFRKAIDATEDVVVRKALTQTLVATRQLSNKNISIEKIADDFLSDPKNAPAKEAFLKAAGAHEWQICKFSIDVHEFERQLSFQVFELDNGVVVWTPVDLVNNGVTVKEGAGKSGKPVLSCEGEVKSEKVRARRGA